MTAYVATGRSETRRQTGSHSWRTGAPPPTLTTTQASLLFFFFSFFFCMFHLIWDLFTAFENRRSHFGKFRSAISEEFFKEGMRNEPPPPKGWTLPNSSFFVLCSYGMSDVVFSTSLRGGGDIGPSLEFWQPQTVSFSLEKCTPLSGIMNELLSNRLRLFRTPSKARIVGRPNSNLNPNPSSPP